MTRRMADYRFGEAHRAVFPEKEARSPLPANRAFSMQLNSVLEDPRPPVPRKGGVARAGAG